MLEKDWKQRTSQVRNVKVPRSMARDVRKIEKVHLHVFADASKVACSAVRITVIEHSSGVVKGLLTSKSRISKRNTTIARLELVSGHMAAMMVKNLHSAVKRWPISSVNLWMDSIVPYTGSATQGNHGKYSCLIVLEGSQKSHMSLG